MCTDLGTPIFQTLSSFFPETLPPSSWKIVSDPDFTPHIAHPGINRIARSPCSDFSQPQGPESDSFQQPKWPDPHLFESPVRDREAPSPTQGMQNDPEYGVPADHWEDLR